MHAIGRSALWMLATLVAADLATAAELTVVSTSPAARSIGAALDAVVTIEFDRPVDRAMVGAATLWGFARWSGTVLGSYRFSDGDRRVTLTPARRFSSGEIVTVILGGTLRAADGSRLRAAGYSFQFVTGASPARRAFTEIDRKTTRSTPAATSRAYGGICSDLNGDGHLDVTIVNEDTRDLRVFLNRADGTGRFDPFLTPTSPVGTQASPSEPSDFNRDGRVDIVVTNPGDNTVSILLGNGDGTFAPQQTVAVGGLPRGVAVLDADGDGDVDVVNANSSEPEPAMSLLRNDGAGRFGLPAFFDAGVAAPWPLAAADMDNDGRLDLVVAGQGGPEQAAVLQATGAAGFVVASTQSSGGQSWMLTCGDVDGDGSEDVAIVLGGTGAGAILNGDGAGRLAAPTVQSIGGSGTASDLGDIDGDGDLDWVTSSYSGIWRLYRNDAGSFAFDQEFTAPAAGSCALMPDFDNDGDLDLVLVDELADEVLFLRNSGICGNGVVEDEDCDDGGESPTCDANCTPAACGDGTLNRSAGEECDDRNTTPGDGCDGGCALECRSPTLGRATGLQAVPAATPDAIDFRWTADPSPGVAEHHLNSIERDKTQLSDPRRSNPAVTWECTVAAPGSACSRSGVGSSSGVSFYQVLSACATGAEGPP